MMYTLGQTYNGNAKGTAQPPWQNKGHSGAHQSRKRLSSSWMRGVNGCFIFGRDHRASDKHSCQEVTSDVRRWKEHPSALLTMMNLDTIVFRCKFKPENGEGEDVSPEVRWTEDDNDGDFVCFVEEVSRWTKRMRRDLPKLLLRMDQCLRLIVRNQWR